MNITKHNTSKRSTVLAFVLLAGMAFSACNKEDDNSSAATPISDDEVAEAVMQSVSASSGGMVYQTESMAEMTPAAVLSIPCGGTSDTTISKSSSASAAIVYHYNLAISRTIICKGAVPSELQLQYAGNNDYTAARMSSVDSVHADFSVSGLEGSAASYVFNENYVRNGSQQSSVRLKRSLTSTINISADNIVVDKASMKISSGQATAHFEGAASGGASTSRGGTITFLGAGKANLVLENGSTYSFSW